jgi:hypothetical protein
MSISVKRYYPLNYIPGVQTREAIRPTKQKDRGKVRAKKNSCDNMRGNILDMTA